jgi:hypothetical protein
MKAPATDEGTRLYERLRDAAAGAGKGTAKKAKRIMIEFESGFTAESIMISRAKTLFKAREATAE